MKGVSEIITAILILAISASLISMTALWLFQSQEKLQGGVEASQKQQIFKEGACMKIKDYTYHLENITVENCGKFPLSKFKVYLNNEMANITECPNEIKPGYSDIIQIEPVQSGNYTVKVTSDYAMSIIAIEIK